MSKKEKSNNCIECSEKIHELFTRCNRCANKASKRKYIDFHDIKDVLDFIDTNGVFVSPTKMMAYEKINDRIVALSTKRKFKFPCLACSSEYETLLVREKKKHYKWHCQSCATSLMWKSPDYHRKHVESIVVAKSTPESIERHSLATKKKWANPKYRDKTLASLRRVWGSKDYKEALSASIKRRWLHNPPICSSRRYEIQTAQGQVTVKSSYERDFVRFLESKDYLWEYETKRFVLNALDQRILIPDFYVKDLDLVVEIKGYFWGDAKEKWEAFVAEYPDVKKTILFKDDLRRLTLGEKNLEDYLEKACG